MFASYRQALDKAGYTVLFQCAGNQGCGYISTLRGGSPAMNVIPRTTNGDSDIRYLAAKRKQPGGDSYVALYTQGGENKNLTRLTVVEAKPLEQDLVQVTAQQISDEIRNTGRVALYGILFDTDQTVPTAASAPALAEIAKLLTSNPTLKLLVVGHTDYVGTYAYNLDLSKRRAEAIVARLSASTELRRIACSRWALATRPR